MNSITGDPPAHTAERSQAGGVQPRKGRGAVSNRDSRYLPHRVEPVPATAVDDALATATPATEYSPETAKSIIARNRSPDVPFEQSINPYRGCEHGCIYCYARPSHAWLDLSPGLDFETRIHYKSNAAQQLDKELRSPSYRCKPITIGANTDPNQPIEKRLRITRQLLEVALRFRQPVSLITRGQGILADLDLLVELSAQDLFSAAISVTTLNRDLKRAMEPRAPEGATRLSVIEALAAVGVPVSVMVAPVIPALNDSELETILEQSARAGATSAAYILLRLPLETRDLFEEWLRAHYPLRARHVMSVLRQSRGGLDYDARFRHRMRGTGAFADLLSRRFQVACRRLGLNQRAGERELDCSRFRVPPARGDQLGLF